MIAYTEVPNHPLIGQVFTDHVQPYGTQKFKIERVQIAGEPLPSYSTRFHIGPQMTMYLSGTVVEGSTTSFLFGHKSTRSAVGQLHATYGVKPHHLDDMSKITVAM